MRLVARFGPLLLCFDLRQRALHLHGARHGRRCLQLRHQLRHLLSTLLDVRQELGPRAGAHLALQLREPLPLARRRLALAPQLLAKPLGLGALPRQGGALGIEALHGGGEGRNAAAEQLAGSRADLRGDAHPRGDLDGRAASDLADLQAVGGRQALEVEPDARGGEPRIGEP